MKGKPNAGFRVSSRLRMYGISDEEQIRQKTAGNKFCGYHKVLEPKENFHKGRKVCHEGGREDNRERAARYGSAVVKNFALVGLYDRLMSEQGGHCALCPAIYGNAKNTRLCFDHDHACCPGDKPCRQCVRGLLCNACNYHLGKLEDLLKRGLVIDRDSVGWTASAVVYLVNHTNRVKSLQNSGMCSVKPVKTNVVSGETNLYGPTHRQRGIR